MKLLGILVCVSLVALTQCNIIYKDCGSTVGSIDKISVSNCDKSPCDLKKGTTYIFNVTFTTKEAVKSAESYVYGIISGLRIAFPIPQPNACVGSNLACPLMAGTTYTYSAKLPVKSLYPDVKVVVEWHLEDGNKKNIFCLETPVAIVG
uniref:NPC intracellular cholesterol transporter 2 n=1 Tax=Ciona savignyi TaxID=51511 RepID=H2YI64_CIOSA